MSEGEVNMEMSRCLLFKCDCLFLKKKDCYFFKMMN